MNWPINPLKRSPGYAPLIVIAASLAITLAISILSLMAGWFIIFQNLFYIPIIIACVYYAKRGYIFSVLVAGLYFALILVFTKDPAIIQGAVIRVVIFILIAWVVTYLSLKQIHVEEELKDSQRRLVDIIEFLPDATFSIDIQGAVIAWNRAMEEMTGVKATEMLGKGDYEYAIPIYQEQRQILLDLVISYDEQTASRYPEITRDGDRLISQAFVPHLNNGKGAHLWIVASPLYDSAGRVAGAIESIRDITAQKASKQALVITIKKLNLLTSVTRHDILNRLTVVQGYLGLLEEMNGDSDAQFEYVRKAEMASASIARLISFTREYQQIGVEGSVWNNLVETIDKAVRDATHEGVSVENNVPADFLLFADPLLEKAFYNLIDNAVRHGGKVTTVRFSSEERAENLIVLCEDNGVGVPLTEKEMIFERGFGKNTGFGLFLTREILSITGITIKEAGEPGKGARFEIVVPQVAYRTA